METSFLCHDRTKIGRASCRERDWSSDVCSSDLLTAGYFIALLSGTTGYYLIFSISLGIYIIGAILSAFLHKRKSGGKFSLKQTYTIFQKDRTWRLLFCAMIGQRSEERRVGNVTGVQTCALPIS